MTITIVGKDAADIAQYVCLHVKPTTDWHEVQVMRECGYGCKLYVRKQGAVHHYQLMHNSTYGCRLGLNPQTAVVKVSIAPKATGDSTLTEGLAKHVRGLSTQQLEEADAFLSKLDQNWSAVMLSATAVRNELAQRP